MLLLPSIVLLVVLLLLPPPQPLSTCETVPVSSDITVEAEPVAKKKTTKGTEPQSHKASQAAIVGVEVSMMIASASWK